MAEFGRAKIKFLKRFLKLTHGIPSHDTFSCLFRMLDPKALDAAFGALSRKLTPQELLATARAHWQIANALHWQLDVPYREDAARNRKDNGPANIAVLRRRPLDVARLDQRKGSLTAKPKRAGWNDEFMLKLLSQMR